MAHSINADRSMTTMSYDQRLQLAIQERFVQYIKPMNIIFYLGKHGEHLLVQADYQRVRAVTNNEGDQAGAYVLLDCLCVYRDWFSCLITALRDPKVKLSHVADKIEADKRSLDLRLQRVELDGGNPEEESFHDDQVQAGLETGGGKLDDVKPKADQLTETRSSKAKLASTLHTERRNVDEAIEDLHIEHEAKVKQLEQENEKLCHRIREDHRPCELRATQLEQQKERELRCFHDQVRELKKEKENLEQLIRQERKHQKDQISLHKEKINELQDETRQRDQLIAKQSTQITNMRNAIGNLEMERKRWVTSKKEISDLLSATQENDGVILFNYYVMCRMRKKHPDLAKKYKIQEWSAPSHLQDTSKWIAWQSSSYIEPSVREVREGGLTAAKEIIQTKLRQILNSVNMWKEKAMNEDEEKYWLQDDILGFFRYCYLCLIGLGLGYNDTAFQQCLEDVHGIIHKDIDMLLSDWADVLSLDTCYKGEQAYEQAIRRTMHQT